MRPNLDPELWKRVRPLFEEAVELEGAERREYVERACGGDERLKERLEAMLAAHGGGESLLDRSLPERLCEKALSGGGEADREELIGVKLRGRFEVERELGEGGFGRVYVARDVRLQGREVAVKVLHGSGASREMLEREVAALARLHHPGIATPRDSGETPGGRPFLVLDYIAGPTLREVIDGGGMERRRVWRMVRQLGAALGEAHREGVWHLDLKPANVLVMRAGEADESAVVVDFGISRISGMGRLASGGSLAYAAPEQVTGTPCAASDQYGLALVVLGMMTGYRPAPLGEHGAAVEDAERKYPGSGKVLGRALAARPEARYGGVGEMVAALEKVLAPAAVGRRVWAGAVMVAVAAVAFAVGFGWWMKERERRMLEADLALLEQQMSVLSAVNRTTNAPPQQTYQSIEWIVENLQTRVEEGHREPKLLYVMASALSELGQMRGHPRRRGVGRSGEGAALIRRALKLAEMLRQGAPDNPGYVSLVLEKHDSLASVLVEMGRYEEAEAVARRGLSVLDEYKRGRPAGKKDDSDLLGARLGLTMTLSRVRFQAKRWEECLAMRNDAIGWSRQVVRWHEAKSKKGAMTEAVRNELAGLLAARGYLLRDMGRPKEALRDYGESDAIVSAFLANYPQNQDMKWLRARNALETGRTYLTMGRAKEARRRLQFALEEIRALSAGPAMDVQGLRALSMTLSYLAVARGGGEGLAKEARQLNAQAREWDPDNAKVRDETAVIENNAAAVGVRLH